MGDVLKKFGRYFLLDHIAQGGMAEIYRARLATIDGAGRLLVIKRIQAGYGANSEFLQMFKSEIKVTMGFNHPNIVQLYDFGEEQQQPYIAMEFVDGKNLRQFMSRFNELKQPFPIELAAYIIEQAAGGLHYAHSFKDKMTGSPLNIVHRDISPQNILISFDGNVKVIDFGIAKASTNSESTRAGVIKGKPAYLSPEQISGETLDGRCDLFALGIVLWELLCGKKLFAGESDLAVLKLIESCTTHVKPPSTINPQVPKELDYIVLRALAKQREKRFQTGEELQRALHKFIYQYNGDFEPGALSLTAKDLFKNEIVEDRKRIHRLNEKVESLLATDLPEPPSAPGVAKSGEDNTTTMVDPKVQQRRQSGEVFDGGNFRSSKVELEGAPQPIKPVGMPPLVAQQSRPVRNSTAGAAPTPRGASTTRSSPAPVQQKIPAQKGSALGGVVAAAAAVLAVAVLGPELGIEIPVLTPMAQQLLGGGSRKPGPTSAVIAKTEAPPPVDDVTPGKTVLLRLNLTPGGGSPTVSINGKALDPARPVLVVQLDAPLELVADRAGYRPFKREFVLDSRQVGGLKEWMMDVPLEPVSFGFLTIHTTPSADATIILDGKPWVRKTPIENEKMPVGSYSIRLSNEILGMEKTINVSIQDGKSATFDERLEVVGSDSRAPASP